MSSKATRRIARIMGELRMQGKLDQPYYPNGKPKPKAEPKPKKESVVEQSGCCLIKYGSNIPAYFRRCPDCPDTVDNSS